MMANLFGWVFFSSLSEYLGGFTLKWDNYSGGFALNQSKLR